MQLHREINQAVPLFLTDHYLYFVEGQFLRIFNLDTDEISNFFKIPLRFKSRVFSRSRLLTRLFRSGVQLGIDYNEDIILVLENMILSINSKTGTTEKEFNFSRGRGPLNLTKVKNIKGFSDGLYFGEYFSNDSMLPVHIYGRNNSKSWEIVYTFPAGKINHVHNLIADPYRDCIWILTGDFGKAAAIYRATEDFKNVELFLGEDQQYRSCVAFPIERGLLYATDSQFEQNNIYLLDVNDKKTSVISEINGSCIYGCEFLNQYVFSTSTEPGNRFKNKILKIIDNKRGPGINKDESHIVIGDMENGFRVAESFKKDIFPYRLFQFGTVKFPNGKNITNKLVTFNVANKSSDQKMQIWTM